MTKEEKLRDNAHRIAGVLSSYAEDPATVKRLAPILAYYAPQLQTDMQDLIRYIWALEDALEERTKDGD